LPGEIVKVQNSEFRVQGSGFRVEGVGFRRERYHAAPLLFCPGKPSNNERFKKVVWGSGFRVQGLGFGVQRLGFRV
jgi:hypothetical protein